MDEFEPQSSSNTDEVIIGTNEAIIQTNRGTSTITEQHIHKEIKSARNSLIKAKEYASSLNCSDTYDSNLDTLIEDIEALFNNIFS